jgi:hypothetical protein
MLSVSARQIERPVLLGFLFVLCQIGSAAATTIVMIRTPNEVVIAADSEGTFEGNAEPKRAESVCKIYQVGEHFFGVAGLVHDPVTKYSVARSSQRSSRRILAPSMQLNRQNSGSRPLSWLNCRTLRSETPKVIRGSLQRRGP